MINILNFSSQRYKNHAIYHNRNYENQLTASNAFILCLKDLPFEDLDNLCKLLQKYYNAKNIPISLESCYQITQSYNTKDTENLILTLAYELVHSGKTLGSKERENNDGPSSLWLNHILLEAEVAEILAKKQGLDTDTAKKLALLHDIGRKFTHTPLHTIAGFEYLVDQGFYDEAFICLTHSFLCNEANIGQRCATSEPITSSYFIEENQTPKLLLPSKRDDITTFLEKYKYNAYDTTINLADSMASSMNIITPYERIKEIEKKSPLNSTYKLALCNKFLTYIHNTQANDSTSQQEKRTLPEMSIDALDKTLYDISLLLMETTPEISQLQTTLKIEKTLK